MVMNNPPHPGRSIRENCLEPLGLNVTEAEVAPTWQRYWVLPVTPSRGLP